MACPRDKVGFDVFLPSSRPGWLNQAVIPSFFKLLPPAGLCSRLRPLRVELTVSSPCLSRGSLPFFSFLKDLISFFSSCHTPPCLIPLMKVGIVTKKKSVGYGFIRSHDLPHDLFFHASNCVDHSFDSIPEGSTVGFEVVEGVKGPMAVGVASLP